MLVELQAVGVLPHGAPTFQDTLRTLNQAAHGIMPEPEMATKAVAAASHFLDDLRRLETQ